MTTSGTVSFSQTRDSLILDSLTDAGVIPVGFVPDDNVVEFASRTLNLMLKNWSAKDGFYLWKLKEFTLFLEKGVSTYLLGPSGDNFTVDTIVSTTLSAAASATDTTITPTSATGIAASAYIGIELNDGTMQWTTVVSIGPIVITNALTANAAAGNRVYAYTTKASRPLILSDCIIRDDSEQDRSINLISRNEYYNFGNKSDTGSVTNVYFQPTTTNATVNVYTTASACTDRLVGIAQFHIEDVSDPANDFDCPQEWLLPIRLNLAVLLTPASASTSTEFKKLKALADEYKEGVLGWDREQTSMYIQRDTK